MVYEYKGKTPLTLACDFIDGYIKKIPAEKLPPEKLFTYHQGVFLSGVENVYKQCLKPEYDCYIRKWLGVVLDDKKRAKRIEGHFWVSLDSLDFRMPGKLLVRLYKETGDLRYLASVAELCESLKDFPTNSKGGFWHMKSQPNQMWLDSLYMASPLCAEYSLISGKTMFGDIAVRQAKVMFDNMRDESNNLLYHGWDESHVAPWADAKTGLSQEKWGRALGWFAVASADIAEILGENFFGVSDVRGNLRLVLESAANYQTNDGFWCEVIDKPDREGNWKENSCTCLLAYATAKAVRLGILDKKYLKCAKKAYEAVADSLREENGQLFIDNICTGTCIESGTYEHYISRETVCNDLHGSGAFLLMCAEMNFCEQ